MDVSYYNPVTQTIVKLSDYFLIPFNMLGLKANTYFLLTLLYLFTFIKLYVPLIINSQIYPINTLLIVSFGYLIKDIVMIYWYLIIISAVKSWFNVFVNHPRNWQRAARALQHTVAVGVGITWATLSGAVGPSCSQNGSIYIINFVGPQFGPQGYCICLFDTQLLHRICLG